MKKIILFLFIILPFLSFAQGNIGADGALHPVGNFGITFSNESKGTPKKVTTIAQRNAILANLRDTGMLCYVTTIDTFYYLKNGILNTNWVVLTSGGGGGDTIINNSTINYIDSITNIINNYIDSSTHTTQNQGIQSTIIQNPNINSATPIVLTGDSAAFSISSLGSGAANLTKLGVIAVPNYNTILVANATHSTVARAAGISLIGAKSLSFQSYASQGLEPQITINFRTLGIDSFPTPAQLPTFKTLLNDYLTNNVDGYGVRLISFFNEENNPIYRPITGAAATNAIAAMSAAVAIAHAHGYEATGGGITTGYTKWMTWRWLMDNGRTTEANTFASNEFPPSQIAGLANWPTDTTNGRDVSVAFTRAIVAAYDTIPIDFMNVHLYFPSNNTSNTSIDTSSFRLIKQAFFGLTHKNIITHEIGQYNNSSTITAQILAGLKANAYGYGIYYSGDKVGGVGAVALQDSDLLLRPQGVLFANTLQAYNNADPSLKEVFKIYGKKIRAALLKNNLNQDSVLATDTSGNFILLKKSDSDSSYAQYLVDSLASTIEYPLFGAGDGAAAGNRSFSLDSHNFTINNINKLDFRTITGTNNSNSRIQLQIGSINLTNNSDSGGKGVFISDSQLLFDTDSSSNPHSYYGKGDDGGVHEYAVPTTGGGSSGKVYTTGGLIKQNDSTLNATLQSVLLYGDTTTKNVYVLNTANTSGLKYLLYGNSVTKGANANNISLAYGNIVAQTYGVQPSNIINNGISGSNLDTFFFQTIPTYNSSYAGISMMWGINEFSWTDARYQSTYERAIDSIIAKGYPLSKINIFQVTPSINNNQAKASLDSIVAKNKGIRFVRLFTFLKDSTNYVATLTDGIHPPNTGHLLIANKIISALKDSEANGAINATNLFAKDLIRGNSFAVYSDSYINGIKIGHGNTNLINNQANAAGSLDSLTTGDNNTSLGYTSLQNDSTGSKNTALGALTMFNNSSGSDQTVAGFSALYNNTTGTGNSAYGSGALYGNVTGNFNVGIGYRAFYANTTAAAGTAIGYQALLTNTTGANNTAVGFQALQLNLSSPNNTAVGASALAKTTGNGNTAIGQGAGFNNTTGNSNSVLGAGAMAANISGGGNTIFGTNANATSTGASSNTAIGNGSLRVVLSGFNTAVGAGAGDSSKAVSNGTFIGYKAGTGLTSGGNNTILGANQFFAGTDTALASTVSISDGLGNKRFFSPANGNVAIGNTNPLAKLHVSGTGIYTDTLTATTMGNADSSNRVATTAWVKRQGFGLGTGTSYYNTNIGTGYNLTVPFTNNVRRLAFVAPLIADSITTANTVTVKFDTSTYGHSEGYYNTKYQSQIGSQAAYTFYGNNTGSSATPTFTNLFTSTSSGGATDSILTVAPSGLISKIDRFNGQPFVRGNLAAIPTSVNYVQLRNLNDTVFFGSNNVAYGKYNFTSNTNFYSPTSFGDGAPTSGYVARFLGKIIMNQVAAGDDKVTLSAYGNVTGTASSRMILINHTVASGAYSGYLKNIEATATILSTTPLKGIRNLHFSKISGLVDTVWHIAIDSTSAIGSPYVYPITIKGNNGVNRIETITNQFPNLPAYTTGGNKTVVLNTTSGRLETGTSGTQVVEISGTTQAAVPSTIYIPHNAALTSITVAASFVVGDLYQIVGEGAGKWKLLLNSGQTIVGVGGATTTGTSGGITATDRYCTITLRAVSTTTLVVTTSQGTLTFL